MGRRSGLFHGLFALTQIALLSTGMIIAPTVLAVHDEGIFELDGNAVDQAAPGDDWQNGTPGADDTLFIPGSVEKDGVDTTYFKEGGSKDHHDLDEWKWSGTDVAPDKDELLDVFAAVYENGDTLVYFGADKFDDSGDAQIGFWFFQDQVSLDADGTFNGLHTVGDVLVLSDFTNGGNIDLICVYEWNPPGDDIANGVPDDTGCDIGNNVTLVAAGAECDVSSPDGSFDVCAKVNDGPADTAPWAFTNKDGDHTFGAGQFFEGGINLSQLFGGDAPCFSTFLAETRSSQEVEAQLKDFALGSLDTCVPPVIETHVQQNGQNVSSINVGESVVDLATFSGSHGEVTGTVDFFVCGPGQTKPDCSNGGTKVGVTKTITNESATSDAFTPTAIGWYCFRAEYTPAEDSEYLAGEHTNDTTECFRVIPADVQIVKTPNSGTVSAGTDISFTLSWANEGEGSASGVVVTDTLPTGGGLNWSISGSTGTGSLCTLSAGDVLTCNIGTIAGNPNFPNAAPVNGTVTLTSATTAASCGAINNTGQITSSNDGTDTDPGQITVLCPDVTVVKTPDGGSVNAGETATFTIVVTNLGPGTATGVTLTDNLPAGYTWTLGGADAADCSINTVPSPDVLSCNFGTLADDETRTITLSAPTSGGNCDVIPNTANVAATNEPAGATGNNSDSADIDVECAVIDIEKTADPEGPVNAGDTIGFDIVVTNNGDGTANDVSVTDNLPAGVDWSINPDVAGCSISGLVGAEVLTCTRDTLAAGASFTVHIEGVTDAADCGTVNNTAIVTTSNDGGDSDGDSVEIRCPDVQAIKVADASPVNAGDPIGFTVTIRNNGTGTAYGATGSDTLPAGIDWTIDGPASGWSINAGVLSFGPADLAAGASASVHIVGTTDPADCGNVPNTVTVDATNESNDSSVTDDNSASDDVDVNCPDLQVVKTATDDAISAGEVAEFSIVITNIGDGTAYDVSLTDTLPGGVAWHLDSVAFDGVEVADPAALCTIAGISLSCPDLGDLAPDGEITITISGDTDLDDCGPLVNSVTVGASNEDEGDLGNNADSATVVVDCPELAIDKDADHADPVLIGSPIGFTITIQNNGAGTAFGVTVSDTLDSDFSWSIESSDSGWSLVGNVLSFSGNLAAGATSSVHVTAPTTIGDSDQCGLVPNTAVLEHPSIDPTPASASEAVQCPDIDVEKTADAASVEAGNQIGFTVTISNDGDGEAQGLAFTDDLPGGPGVDWTIDALNSDAGWSVTGTAPDQQLVYAPTTLAANSSSSVHVVSDTTDDSCGQYDNTATVTTTNDGSDEDSDSVMVECPVLTIDKSVAEEEFTDVGQVLHYTIVVTNVGNVALHNVIVTDAQVTDLVCDPATPVAELAVGDSITCTATHTTTQEDLDLGFVFNEACTDDGMGDGDTGANPVCDDVTTPGQQVQEETNPPTQPNTSAQSIGEPSSPSDGSWLLVILLATIIGSVVLTTPRRGRQPR